MLAKRIIPCLDVRNNQVVKGIKFDKHQLIGEIIPLASRYNEEDADELVFYDIVASSEQRYVSAQWIEQVASVLSIPFTVAGGIRNLEQAECILKAGADKISINSPALENPELINQFSHFFGRQCLVIGIDSQWVNDDFYVFQYTGNAKTMKNTQRKTLDWVKEIQQRGAGEIVLNCMQSDGMRQGYDLEQLIKVRAIAKIPLVASGGAGSVNDFVRVFQQTGVDAALAATVFHQQSVSISALKQALTANQIEVR